MTAGRHYVLGTWRIWHPVQGSRIYILTLLRTIRIWIKSMMRGSIEMLFALQFYLIFKAFLISFVKVLLCGATGQPQALYQPYNSNTKWQWHFTTTVHWCCPLWIGLYARWSLWTTENGKHLFMNDICRVTWHRQLFWIQEHISEWRGTAPALPPPLGRGHIVKLMPEVSFIYNIIIYKICLCSVQWSRNMELCKYRNLRRFINPGPCMLFCNICSILLLIK